MNLNSVLQKIKCLKKNLMLNKKSGDLQGTTHPDKLPNSEMELKATQTMKKHIKDIKSELNVIKQESEEQAPASSRTWQFLSHGSAFRVKDAKKGFM